MGIEPETPDCDLYTSQCVETEGKQRPMHRQESSMEIKPKVVLDDLLIVRVFVPSEIIPQLQRNLVTQDVACSKLWPIALPHWCETESHFLIGQVWIDSKLVARLSKGLLFLTLVAPLRFFIIHCTKGIFSNALETETTGTGQHQHIGPSDTLQSRRRPF